MKQIQITVTRYTRYSRWSLIIISSRYLNLGGFLLRSARINPAPHHSVYESGEILRNIKQAQGHLRFSPTTFFFRGVLLWLRKERQIGNEMNVLRGFLINTTTSTLYPRCLLLQLHSLVSLFSCRCTPLLNFLRFCLSRFCFPFPILLLCVSPLASCSKKLWTGLKVKLVSTAP